MQIKTNRFRSGLTLIETAVVIIVIGVLISILATIANNFAALRTVENETDSLKSTLSFCRTAAIKSNQVVYLSFDFDEKSYHAYRYLRTEEALEKKIILSKRFLSTSNSIVGISFAGGKRVEKGTVDVPFSPDGVAEELAVYFGTDIEIKSTLIYSRYGNDIRVYEGVFENSLEDENWQDDLELK